NIKLKRSSNNLWQLKKVARKQQRVVVEQRVAQRKVAPRNPAARNPAARRSSSSTETGTTSRSTFHRRTQHTWPQEAILKGTANASTKLAVLFFLLPDNSTLRYAHIEILQVIG